jgi:DNA repair ATPase RecN
MWRKKNDNLQLELSTDKTNVSNTLKKKYSVKIDNLQDENQKLRSELDMLNNAARQHDQAHQQQIK